MPDDDDDLPIRLRSKPPRPAPPQPVRKDPLPIRFARKVLADPDTVLGQEYRLDRPVSKSIISKKCREFAEAYGVELSTRVDLVDPDDPTSERKTFLWCVVLPDTEVAAADVQIIDEGAEP